MDALLPRRGGRRRPWSVCPRSRACDTLGGMKKKHPPIDWSQIDVVVGTLEDVTHTGIKRPCRECRRDVYTSIVYPFDVAIVCLECAIVLAKKEKGEPRGGG